MTPKTLLVAKQDTNSVEEWSFPFPAFAALSLSWDIELDTDLKRNSMSTRPCNILYFICINDNIQFETRRKDSHLVIAFSFSPW